MPLLLYCIFISLHIIRTLVIFFHLMASRRCPRLAMASPTLETKWPALSPPPLRAAHHLSALICTSSMAIVSVDISEQHRVCPHRKIIFCVFHNVCHFRFHHVSGAMKTVGRALPSPRPRPQPTPTGQIIIFIFIWLLVDVVCDGTLMPENAYGAARHHFHFHLDSIAAAASTK